MDSYNRPGSRFRTGQYLILIVIAWTALFHAIFYRRKVKPLYKAANGRFIRVDGEPKHWDLSKCLAEHYKGEHPPARKNLDFLIGLRNKIEHRNLPELDPSLYGECQAALMNLEELVVQAFGDRYALGEQLAVALQFSTTIPPEKRKAAKKLAAGAKDVRSYVETFRGSLPTDVLNSMKYSFNVFLVPKVANRKSAADAAVEFVHVDEANSEEMKRLDRLNVLIKEKKIPIANLDLLRPAEVVEQINQTCPNHVTLNTHTACWKYFRVRPPTGSDQPHKCLTQYCIYDSAHSDYLYTRAWVKKLIGVLSDPAQFNTITGRLPAG